MLPETIELWAGRLTAWAAFSGAFAGIATIGALIFSNWDGDNKAEALKQYKEDAKKDADEVKKKVALAGEGQAKANESIALANERTALAELKIEEMRAKNSELARRVDPRTLGEHKPFGLELTAFKGTKARIEYLSNDEECRKNR